jgi:hypothetical protein
MLVSRLLAAATVGLVLVATADALRTALARDRRGPSSSPATTAAQLVVLGRTAGLRPAGRPFRTRVVRGGGRLYLSQSAVVSAFPSGDGPIDIDDLSVSPDGTLVLAVRRFPVVGPWRSALELWRGRRLVAAVPVGAGAFAGGIVFAAGGRAIAALDVRGRPTWIDATGRRLARA